MTLLEAVLYNNLSWASFNFLGAPGLGFSSSTLSVCTLRENQRTRELTKNLERVS